MKETIRQEIIKALSEFNETWEDIISISNLNTYHYIKGKYEDYNTVLSDKLLDNDELKLSNCAYTVWTKNRVYCPQNYDGFYQGLVSMSRNPDGKPTSIE